MQPTTSKIHVNTFQGGLNKDASDIFKSSEQYLDAQNLSLIENGKFYSLQNLNGSTKVQDIMSSISTDIIGAYPCRYTIGSTSNINCWTIVTATTGGNYNIWCYDIDNDALYSLFQETTSDGYNSASRTLDVVLYPEGNYDILYFTDNFHGLRKIRCYIPTPYVANFLSENDLAVVKRGAIGKIELSDIVDGGNLLCGSYQVSYQLVNPDKDKYTRYSLLTTPIYIFNGSSTPPNNYEYKAGGVGISTNKKILLSITPTAEELLEYTHIRLAVLEHVHPEGTVVQTAGLTDIIPISKYLTGDVIKNVPITTNLSGISGVVPLEDIVVDLAAIETVKTIATRQNRLFAGNITYQQLEYDNGTPEITSGSVLQTPVDIKNNYSGIDTRVSKYKGYFRDEVYRYAISYFNEHGNFSSPRVLDMKTIDENTISSSVSSSNSLITNANFVIDLTDWGNYDPGTGGEAWVWDEVDGVSYATVEVAGTGGVYSDMLVHNFTPTVGLTYTALIRGFYIADHPTIPVTSTTTQIVYMDGFSVLGTQSITLPNTVSTDSSIYTTSQQAIQLVIPSGTTQIAVRGQTSHLIGATTSTLYLDYFDVVESLSDMKFPRRDQIIGGERFSILSASNIPLSLGLRLVGVKNHPTWAKGFVILRSKRKKNVLWQSPLIPLQSIYGIGPIADYPNLPLEADASEKTDFPDASPMGPNTTYFDSNLFLPGFRQIIENGVSSGTGLNKRVTLEARQEYLASPTHTLFRVFPDSIMYSENNKYVHNHSHKLDTIDAALVGVTSESYGETGTTVGLKRSISGTFYANASNQYYYDSGHSGSKGPLRGSLTKTNGFKSFDNLAEPFSLNGKDIFNIENLTTDGISYSGVKGSSISRGGVIETIPIDGSINVPATPFASGSAYTPTGSNNLILSDPQLNVNAVEIVNCVTGIGDDRYGSIDSLQEFIFTGAHVVFSTSELALVEVGAEVLKTVDVYGGDCFISPHIFKINDTNYFVANQNKHNGTGASLSSVASTWTKAFSTTEGGVFSISDSVVTLPIAVKNMAQYIELYLESEYLGFVTDQSLFEVDTTSDPAQITLPRKITSEALCRSPLTYDYNYNYNNENDQKIFFNSDPLVDILSNNKARIFYSDVKVYQTNISGFDNFRVLNFYDLDESYGSITKLITAGDELYALQERATTLLPVGERIIEQSDTTQLSVRSGDVIGTPLILNSTSGCSHQRGVASDGRSIYFPDINTKKVYQVFGKEVVPISNLGLNSEFRALFSTTIPENELVGVYDTIRNDYWILNTDGSFCYIGNNKDGKFQWITNLELDSENIIVGGAIKNSLYLIGKDSTNQIGVSSFYTGTPNLIFENYRVPRVTIVSNPDFNIGKTFDDVLLNSTDQLDTLDIIVKREAALGNQTSTGILLNTSSRGEGNFRAKVLFDAANARLRGPSAEMTFKWKTGVSAPIVTLSSILTKYRPSENIF